MYNQYDAIAEKYVRDAMNYVDDEKLHTDLVTRAGFQFFPNLSFCDLGCGSGIHLRYLAKAFPEFKRLVGVDLSSVMISIAQSEKSLQKIDYEVCDMSHTPFENNFFDFVYSRYAVHYLESLVPALKEANRITKQFGIFVFQVSHPIFDLFCSSKKDYGMKESVNFKAAGSEDVVVCHPTHTFEEYISAILESGWKLVETQEHFGPKSDFLDFNGFRIPTLMIFKLLKEAMK